jgi:hypothetical protein
MASNIASTTSKHQTPLCSSALVDARTFTIVSVDTTDMMSHGLMKAILEPKHMMIVMRCMGAAPNGD